MNESFDPRPPLGRSARDAELERERAARDVALERERAARRDAAQARQDRDALLRQPVPAPVAVFVPPRRRWPGLLAAGVIGAGMAAVAISSFYDQRTLGQKLDATVEAAHSTLQRGADEAATQGAQAGDRLAGGLSDAGITAAVKAALATDPSLSALHIDVSTQSGVVTLEGPAPDEKARERATTLASAPQGVQRVDNRLVVSAANG